MKYRIVGIDLAKTVFQICALNRASKVAFNRKITRAKLPMVVEQWEPTVIAMEACGSANYWARRFEAMGHTVRLVPAQHVKAMVRGNKNDANDALAICETALRPDMHFVPIKSLAQQDGQMLHRVRQRHVQQSTALANQIRAFLRERGLVVGRQIQVLIRSLPSILEDGENGLSPLCRELLCDLYTQLRQTREHIAALNQRIAQWCETDADAKRLMSLPGYGPILASALVCAVGDGRQFRNGRQLAAWVGLTPRHVGTGGKNTVLSTSKAGNNYLRTLLVHGARTVATWCANKTDRLSRWLQRLIERRGRCKAIVALANKCARIAWVLLTRKECFRREQAVA